MVLRTSHINIPFAPNMISDVSYSGKREYLCVKLMLVWIFPLGQTQPATVEQSAICRHKYILSCEHFAGSFRRAIIALPLTSFNGKRGRTMVETSRALTGDVSRTYRNNYQYRFSEVVGIAIVSLSLSLRPT